MDLNRALNVSIAHRRIGHRLIAATLRCRDCSRAAGDLVGYADQPLAEASFLAVETDSLPRPARGKLRCARCTGQLYLDEIQVLGRNVPISEAGGVRFAEVIRAEEGSSAA